MKISNLRILRSSLFIDVVQLLGYQIGSRVFCFSGKSLKGEIFSFFFGSVCTEGFIFFCLSPSLPSHLGNSAELVEFCQVRPSFNRLIEHLVYGVGIYALMIESVTNQPSRTRLDRFFEPCYKFAKYGGPWLIFNHYLTLRPWWPNFDTDKDDLRNMLVWVRIPCLPIEYYDHGFLMKLGAKIGKPGKIDSTSSLITRGHFARICMEVDLKKPLISKFELRRRTRRIEYEGIHLV